MNNQITKIYLVTNCYGDPNKVYIGKEKNNKGRHSSRNYDHRKRFGEGIIFTYIDQVESLNKKDWEPLETFWIEYFRQLGFDLQNKRMKGGSGPCFQSQETKDKISLANKNMSQETILKMKLAKQNVSQEFKDKIGRANTGKIHSQETKNKIGMSNSKPILQYDKQSNFIKEWPNSLTVNKVLGIDRSDISRVCKGRGKTAGGYKWKYKY